MFLQRQLLQKVNAASLGKQTGHTSDTSFSLLKGAHFPYMRQVRQ